MKQRDKTLFIVGTIFLFTIICFSYTVAEEINLTPNPPVGKAVEGYATVGTPPTTPAFNPPTIDKLPPRPNHPPIDQIPPMPMPELKPNDSNAMAPELVAPVSYDPNTKEEITGIPGEAAGELGDAWGGGYCGSDGNCGSEMTPATMGCMTKITDTSPHPWRMNAKLIMRFGSSWYVCSGSMYDAETVLTAGHCVYDTTTNTWASEIWVYPGWDGKDPYPNADPTPNVNNYGYAYWEQATIFNGWINDDVNYDIGIVTLNRAAGMLTGWFGWKTYTTCPTSDTFNSASYPAEGCGQPGLHNGRDLYYWTGTFNYCPTWNTIGINTPGADNCLCAVWGGMSGSSAYFYDGTNRFIHAITSRSNRDTFAEYTRMWDAGVSTFADIINNNARTSTFDLQPLDMNFEPATIVAGQSPTVLNHLAVNATNGTKNSAFSFGLYLSTDDTITSADTLLATYTYSYSYVAMQSARWNMGAVPIPANTPPGKYWIGVLYGAATDGNTSNNGTNTWDAVPITVVNFPDLIVQNITTNPVNPCPGQSTEVTVTVKNQGAVAAGRFFVTFFQNSATTPPMCDAGTYYWDIAGGLAAGATTNLTTTITYGAPGTFKMWAIADACSEVAETNENNNMLAQDITVPTCGSPDLTVKSITTTPPFPNNGDVVSVDILFANLGAYAAPNGFSLDFYKNRGTPPSLGDAGDTSEAFPPNMPCCGFEYHMYTQVVYDACGSYNMWAQIDTYNANAEENESNNVFGPQKIAVCGDCPNYDEIRPLVRQYYLAILDREPDGPGWDFWTDDICRISTDQGCQLIDKLGIFIGEGFQALARLHFNSPEYVGKGKTNTAFVTDCYEVFMERSPDAPGLTFWLNQMSQGYTRNMVITSFANSPEYKAILASSFGIDTTRPENNLLNDLYRGFLNVFPDADGFKYYLNLMRDAQCAGNPVALKNLCAQIAFTFTHSAQYAGRGRDNSGFVEDLYNAILRRGADAPGFLFWVGVLNGGTSRDTVLQEFINGPEFQGRVQKVVDIGCCNANACQPQQCGTYTFDCSPGNPNCLCLGVAEGGGACAPNFTCGTTVPCPNGTVDCPAGQKCYVNTCCGAPICGPTECSAPTSASLEGELTAAGVTPVAPADTNPW